MNKYDVIIIGGGPAGLAAAKTAYQNNKVLLIEREEKLGGILKQCIHEGFGLTRYKEQLTGPEYAYKEIEALPKEVEVKLLTFVSKIEKTEEGEFVLTLVTKKGMEQVKGTSLIFTTGCKERTAKQIMIEGANPNGVFTAGQAQHYINLMGKMVGKKFVILGSGDIGLIMARRITLEGGKVLGVYEIKNTPSGLTRNIVQCLEDYDIPLYLSHTVKRIYGDNQLEGIDIVQVDEKFNYIKGTEKHIECDALILSVGLIPETELITSLGVKINPKTNGPDVDQTFMTNVNNAYSAGNSTHVNDLVDYVSESGAISGKFAAKVRLNNAQLINIKLEGPISYVVPNKIDLSAPKDKIVFYFRAAEELKHQVLSFIVNGESIYRKNYVSLKPPEMERFEVSIPDNCKEITILLERKKI